MEHTKEHPMTATTMILVEFLRARLDEDEAVARAATPGPWYWEPPSKEEWPSSDESLRSSGKQTERGYDECVLQGWGYDASGIDGSAEDRAHIARHDPARVLAEVEAKRRILDQLDFAEGGQGRSSQIYAGAVRTSLRFLSLPYADHPDYRDEWRP